MNAATLCLTLILLAGVAGCAGNPPSAAVESELLHPRVSVGGIARTYALSVPSNYDGKKAWPLIVFLNGSGECGTDGVKQATVGLGPAAAAAPGEWPFIIVYPQKPDRPSAWSDHDDLVMAVIEETQRQLKVDRSRIYLTGLSQGGAGTWAIAAKHPKLFAAIAPICGFGDPTTLAPALRDVPTWAFHGEKDDVVPPAKTREIVAAIQAAGGHPKATYFPEANHNSWDSAYRTQDLGDWFLRHSTR
jgi:predicted peptidase